MFLHFMHQNLLDVYNLEDRIGRDRLLRARLNALRWAVLVSDDDLILPSSDILTLPPAGRLAQTLQHLSRHEIIRAVGSSVDVESLLESKREHFAGDLSSKFSDRPRAVRLLRKLSPALERRWTNTTSYVSQKWTDDASQLLGGGGSTYAQESMRAAVDGLSSSLKTKALTSFLALPERLEGHAFLWSVIDQLNLLDVKLGRSSGANVEMALAWHWLSSHLDEYQTGFFSRIPGMGLVDCGIRGPNDLASVDLIRVERFVRACELSNAIFSSNLDQLVAMRGDYAIEPLRNLLRNMGPYESRTRAVSTDMVRRIVDSQKDARDPVDALRRASAVVERSYFGGNQGVMVVRESRVLLAVALEEELRTILATLQAAGVEVESRRVAGRYFYRGKFADGDVTLLIGLIGRGPTESSAVSSAVLATIGAVDLVISVGISGRMSDDVGLGDVVVGSSIQCYLENAKVHGSGRKLVLRPAGTPVKCSRSVYTAAQNFEFTNPDAYKRWRRSSTTGKIALVRPPSIVIGPLAAGPVVVGSTQFKSWILSHKRDYLAVDQESGSVGLATEVSNQAVRYGFAAVRGISDNADEDKSLLDNESKGELRAGVLRSATLVVLELIKMLNDPPGEVDPSRVP